ncbi:MAG: glycosyltransferase family 2 protein [Motilibacteraceae bacterium]
MSSVQHDRRVDVLVPTVDRPTELAVTLAGLSAQEARPHRVVVSDQTRGEASYRAPAVATVVRLLEHTGVEVELHHRPERRGVAEQRAFLLSRADAGRVLCLDDDVLLRPHALRTMGDALDVLRCGFVGMAVQGLSFKDDVRPDELVSYEEWEGEVLPERVAPESAAWERWRLHNAANLLHLAEKLGLAEGEWRAYKVAWVGGCAMYDRERLLECGGFDFWGELPSAHSGEDVLAQLRVMARYGGAGLVPSAAYHLEAPTTVLEREHEAYQVVGLP